MHISLTEQQEEWIQSLIRSGHYTSISEVVRHAIRLLQEEAEVKQVRLSALRDAVKRGADEIERGEFSQKGVQEILAEGKGRKA